MSDKEENDSDSVSNSDSDPVLINTRTKTKLLKARLEYKDGKIDEHSECFKKHFPK